MGRSAAAARRALELAGDQPAENSWAGSALGQALYLSGQAAEARPWLEDLVSQVPASVQPYAVVTALAVLSLLAADQDDPRRRLAGPWRGGNGRGTRGQLRAADWDRLPGAGTGAGPPGELAEAEVQLGRALELFEIDSMGLHRTLALLVLASVRHGRGDLPGARALADQARELVDQSTDPGMLPAAEADRGSAWPRPRRPVQMAAPLTERELAVLRLHPAVDAGDRP